MRAASLHSAERPHSAESLHSAASPHSADRAHAASPLSAESPHSADHSRTSSVSHLDHSGSHKEPHAKHADPHHKKNSNIGLIICGIILLILIVIIYILALVPTMSITKKNITATKNLTVNGTLIAKSTSTETTFNNITCTDQFSFLQAGADSASSYFTEGGLYIGSNMSNGSAELDIIAINQFASKHGGNSTTAVLNIYTSLAGAYGAYSSSVKAGTASYTNPLVSMTEDTVAIGGNLSVTNIISFIDSTDGDDYSTIGQSGLNLSIVAPAGGYVYSQNGLVLAGSGTGSGTISCVSITASGKIESNGVPLTSDYRLKEEIEPISNEYSIDKLKPCSYLLKDDESKTLQTGFIAHELQEIFPHLVNGEKDGERMQSVNYMGLIAILTKELQSLKSVMMELKADITMLKADNVELKADNFELKADNNILKADNIELKAKLC